MNAPIDPEFSRPFRLRDLPRDGATVELDAGVPERDALARRMGVVSLDRLTATLTLEPNKGGRQILVRGRFAADLTQSCVITLEPFAVVATESFVVRFDRNAAAAEPDDGFVDLVDDELAEPIVGETIDLGELVAQYLALAIDPYPRRPGAQFDQAGIGLVGGAKEDDRSEDRSPFATLASLGGNRQR